MLSWLTDLKKTALVVLVLAALSAVYPSWTGLRTSLALFSWHVGLLAAGAMLLIFGIPMSFLFVLFRSNVRLQISKGLRRLALISAVVGGVEEVTNVFDWLPPLLRDPHLVAAIVDMMGLLAETAFILFLVAIVRHVDDAPTIARSSRFLLRISQLAVVIWSLLLLAVVFGGVYLVVLYQDLAFKLVSPPLRQEMLYRLHLLAQAALLLVPPYIIYRSLRQTSA
jgi:hypothetical protein